MSQRGGATIHVPVKFEFDGLSIKRVLAAYRQKMKDRTGNSDNTGITVTECDRNNNSIVYRVSRAMPRWFTVFGGRPSVDYDEVLTIDPATNRMITSSDQKIPVLGSRIQTKITFMEDDEGTTVVFGTIKASDVPRAIALVATGTIKKYVENTFKFEREAELERITA